MMPIPVLDLFAGPGGLGEGFVSFAGPKGQQCFNIRLSIEKEPYAHKTLELRAFCRHFAPGNLPESYYAYLRGDLQREELFARHPEAAKAARAEAWLAELGSPEFPSGAIDDRIRSALGRAEKWVLIGGPPCQAYSLVGRSRIVGGKGREEYEKDHRHFLYREYLRILEVHRPPVFVFENVKGILSASVKDEGIFSQILNDLQGLGYTVHSLVHGGTNAQGRVDPSGYVVRMEDFGIPQTRHRVILLGTRNDIHGGVNCLRPAERITVEDVLSDLPRLRSGVSKDADSPERWLAILESARSASWVRNNEHPDVRTVIHENAERLSLKLGRGGDRTVAKRGHVHYAPEWYEDPRLEGVCNHSTRSHIASDLHRYLFASCFARAHGRSPELQDFPRELLPAHRNVAEALTGTKFNDRFRVQVRGRPATTITAHISKDGHYFIHYDPSQCRSLTVREAARIQTFPDNYFFEGPRTEQYRQVGNAVPPLLAYQIAEVVARLFE